MKTPSKNNFIAVLKKILLSIPKNYQLQFGLLLSTMVCSAMLETLALSVVALFASTITDPYATANSKYIMWVAENISLSFLLDPKTLVLTLSITVIVLITIKNTIRAFVIFWISRFSVLLEAFFGNKLIAGFLYTDYEWVQNENTADLIYAIEWRKHLGRNFIAPSLMGLCDVIVVFFLFVTLLVIEPLMSLTSIILLSIIAYLIYFKMRSWLDKIAEKSRDYEQIINKEVTKAIHGIKDVKVSTTQEYFINNFNKNAIKHNHFFSLQQFISQSPALILESIGFFLLCSIVCLMLFVLGASLSKITGFMALLGVAAWRILPAMNRLIGSITYVRNSLPYIATEMKYLDKVQNALKFRQNHGQKNKSKITFTQEIYLDQVCFSYKCNSLQVLSNLHFSIYKGETLGVIGFSGSGKSTFVDLLIGLLNCDKGMIFIDGVPLNNRNLLNWTEQIGYVPQTQYLFDGTLSENVAFGIEQKDIDRKKIVSCCRMAAMDYLDDLPSGIDTIIGERGIRLSGGQRQRVAIARALYRDPDVLIFDEATSALDTKNEKEIQKTIYSFKGKQTLLIIAHRLSTVRNCDRLIWIEGGKIHLIDSPEVVLPLYKKELAIEKKGQFNAELSQDLYIHQ
jgi:ABC-type multidrug transport system fused ATPase/permease subunit